MGNVLGQGNNKKENERRIWPIRSWYHVPDHTQYEAVKYGNWDPAKYNSELKYPAQEPAKDY